MINNFCLIIGSGKCGTTSLFSYLAQHPQICPSRIKEPSFFAEDRILSRGLDWYYGLWQWNPNQHKFALEASTSYTKIPIFNNVAETIFKYPIHANFKFIYMMRNPIEKIESHFRYSGTSISSSDLIKPSLIETSQYAKQIDEYYKRFPVETILLLNFEDLKTNPSSLLKKVCKFLEIDSSWNFKKLDTVHNASRDLVFNDPLWQTLKKIEILRFLASYIPYNQKRILHSFFGKKAKHSFKLSANQKRIILNELKHDLRRLKLEYGVNLNSWGINID